MSLLTKAGFLQMEKVAAAGLGKVLFRREEKIVFVGWRAVWMGGFAVYLLESKVRRRREREGWVGF